MHNHPKVTRRLCCVCLFCVSLLVPPDPNHSSAYLGWWWIGYYCNLYHWRQSVSLVQETSLIHYPSKLTNSALCAICTLNMYINVSSSVHPSYPRNPVSVHAFTLALRQREEFCVPIILKLQWQRILIMSSLARGQLPHSSIIFSSAA